MSGPQPCPSGVTREQRALLEELVRCGTVTRRVVRRAQIILETADGADYEQVAQRLGVGQAAVHKWCNRWRDAKPLLDTAAAEPDSGRALRRLINELLSTAAGRASPSTSTAECSARKAAAGRRQSCRSQAPIDAALPGAAQKAADQDVPANTPSAAPSTGALYWVPVLTFLIVLAGGLLFAKVYDTGWQKDRSNTATELATAYALTIERRLTRSLSAAYILGSMVRLHDMKSGDFEDYAADISRSLGGINSLQLAPNGVVRHVHPAAGQEGSVDHNILRDAGRRREAYLAVVTERLTLAGPVVSAQGDPTVIGTYPVFRKGSRAEEQFWGFVLVVIDLEELLVESGLPQLADKGYHYQLSQLDPDTGEAEVLAGLRDGTLQRPTSYHVPLPNKHWVFSIAPKDAADHGPLFRLLVASALVVSALMGYMVFVLLRQPVLLRRLVAERTRQLVAENHERRLAEQRARESERRFQRLAQHDELTGLPNRLLFRDRLQQALLQARRSGTMMALMFIDLDRFKPVNDALGHDAGDELLRQVAARLHECVRKSDTVARIGGDEFTAILPGLRTPTDAVVVAQKIIRAVGQTFAIREHAADIGCSIGIALFPVHGDDVEGLMHSADAAMYRAKEQGRGVYRFAENPQAETAGAGEAPPAIPTGEEGEPVAERGAGVPDTERLPASGRDTDADSPRAVGASVLRWAPR